MRERSKKAQTVRQPAQKLHEPAIYPRSGWIHSLKHPKHHLNGTFLTIQAATMKEVVEQQKTVMQDLDIDKLDDIRDEMDELKYESDYMNEMLNRDYDVDID